MIGPTFILQRESVPNIQPPYAVSGLPFKRKDLKTHTCTENLWSVLQYFSGTTGRPSSFPNLVQAHREELMTVGHCWGFCPSVSELLHLKRQIFCFPVCVCVDIYSTCLFFLFRNQQVCLRECLKKTQGFLRQGHNQK